MEESNNKTEEVRAKEIEESLRAIEESDAQMRKDLQQAMEALAKFDESSAENKIPSQVTRVVPPPPPALSVKKPEAEPKATELSWGEKRRQKKIENEAKKREEKKAKKGGSFSPTMQVNLLEEDKKEVKKKPEKDNKHTLTPSIVQTYDRSGNLLHTEEPAQAPERTLTAEERFLEEKLREAREKYADEYKNFLAKRKKGLGKIARTKEFVTGVKIKNSETPRDLMDLEMAYDQAAIVLGQEMLKEGKTTIEIFKRVIVQEQETLNALKAENLPPKEKGVFRKSLEWYIGIKPPWKKVTVSLALSTPVVLFLFPSAVVAAGGSIGFATSRGVRAFAGSAIGLNVAKYGEKAYDYLLKRNPEEIKKKQEEELAKVFWEDAAFSETKKLYIKTLEQEKRAKRARIITKAVVAIGAGGLASYGAGVGLGKVLPTAPSEVSTSGAKDAPPESAPKISTIPEMEGQGQPTIEDQSAPTPITQPPPTGSSDPGFVKTPQEAQDHVEPVAKSDVPITGKSESLYTNYKDGKPYSKVFADGHEELIKPATENVPPAVSNFINEGVKFDHGKGGIQGILDLKNQIRNAYPDISKAPQNVQDFMKTDATKEAIRLGFYDPNNPNESALILKGQVLKFDEQGKLLFGKPDASGKIPELGDKYHGKMFDADRPVTSPKTGAVEHATGAKAVAQAETGGGGKTGERIASDPAKQETSTLQTPTEPTTVPKTVEEAKSNALKAYEKEKAHTIGETVEHKTESSDEFRNKTTTPPQSSSEILQKHPEFAKNYFKLPKEQLAAAAQVYESHVQHMASVPGHEYEWGFVKNLSINRGGRFSHIVNNYNEESPVGKLLHRAYEVTGLKPNSGFIFSKKQSVEQWLIKMLQKAAEKGTLDQVKF